MASEVSLGAAEQAAEAALLHFVDPDLSGVSQEYRSLWASSNLRPSHLRPEPREVQEIFNINGEMLFRDFVSITSNGLELRIRTAATTLVETPVISVGINSPVRWDDKIKAVREHAEVEGFHPVEGPQGIVCYSYPKLGLLCHSENERWVFDLNNHARFEVDRPLADRPTELQSVNPLLLSSFDARHLRRTENQFNPSTRALQEMQTLSGMPLIGQDNNHFCAVASAKMILDFHGIDKTQNQIAEAMRTADDGTPAENQAPAYETLSNNLLNAVMHVKTEPFKYDEIFEDIKRYIISGFPIKMGIYGHAYAIAGYNVVNAQNKDVEQLLYVYDPEPEKQGQVRWEDWKFIKNSFLNLIAVHKRSANTIEI